jgi:hypothetical protein
MDYTRLSLNEVIAGLREVAVDAQRTFGTLDEARLNWKPDATQWSVAQCFEHLIAANALVRERATQAIDDPSRSFWQRVPVLPGMFGRLLVGSQSPGKRGKFKASPLATPESSNIPVDIIPRFVGQHHDLAAWVGSMTEDRARRTVMISPFASFISYSVLDGLRLIVAHDRRHFEQARRVLSQHPS